ncbi:hypothetical protein WJX72_011029 [[Myrmecia] bisecta]|uniref:Uncharacterized protein n=1 Tax=[Myrmecia] bisecta TaxID=41462 RepID=A0AAW1PLI7_9CHLO
MHPRVEKQYRPWRIEPQLRVEVANAGAAEVLVCLLSDQFSVWQALKAPAAKTFGGLSAIPPNRRILIQAGAVPVLLRLTECDCQCARENAIFALTQIVQTEDGPEALVQAGAVSVLQRVVFSRHAGWDYVFPNAMRLLQVLGAPHVDPRKADSVIMLTGRVRASAG